MLENDEKAYRVSLQELSRELDVAFEQGLSQSDVESRRKKYGKNTLPEGKRRSLFIIFLRQFKSPLIYILLIAAIIIYAIGEHALDAFVITGILLFNAIIGTVQEWRTRAILQKLKTFVKAEIFVVRDGEKTLVEGVDLVPGDVVLLQEGQRVPADVRIISANGLRVDQAALTGESKNVTKQATNLEQETPVADRENMLFKGTYIHAGSGKAVVVATGDATEIGGIARSIADIDTEMPIRRELEHISRWIVVFIFLFCLILFVVGIATGKPMQELLVMLAALFICVIPEGLPVVLTLALVSGVYRMAQRGVLVKQMQAIEGLGRVDVIAVDKTGTLTRNEMVVSRVATRDMQCEVTGRGYHAKGNVRCNDEKISDVAHDSPLGQLAIACALLDSTELEYDEKKEVFTVKGDPTEAAMGVFAQKVGMQQQELLDIYEKVFEIPFDSEIGYHAGFYVHEGAGDVFVAGSLQELAKRSDTNKETFQELEQELLKNGLRVLAVAKKEFDPDRFSTNEDDQKTRRVAKEAVDQGLQLLGVVGIEDAIRTDVKEVIETTRNAGIRVVMLTGDHKETARYVAEKVGIFHEGDEVIDGSELDTLSDEQALQRLDAITVYSRVTPDAKLRIVQLFHEQDTLIAMTGDGVNDAPPLVAADLGIAMGGIGSEVAKEAADMVLLKDSFVNIVEAMKESRHIFYTLRRVVLYFFSTNMGEILIVLFALLADVPLPLRAVQILWLNFVTDGFLDAALSTEPREQGLLEKSWLQGKVRLVDWYIAGKMIFMAIPMGIGALWMFLHYYQTDIALARTMTLLTMALYQWFNAWNCRSEEKSLVQLGLFSNLWLIGATILVLLLQFALIYIPFMQAIFKTVPLTLGQWGVVVAITAPIVALEEIRKWIVRRWF